VIQNGTMKSQKSGIGTINNITEIVRSNNLSSPAIIILGDVVSEANSTMELSQKIEMYLAS